MDIVVRDILVLFPRFISMWLDILSRFYIKNVFFRAPVFMIGDFEKLLFAIMKIFYQMARNDVRVASPIRLARKFSCVLVCTCYRCNRIFQLTVHYPPRINLILARVVMEI